MSPERRAVLAMIEWFLPGCAIHHADGRMREIAGSDEEVADLLIELSSLAEEIHRAEYHYG